MIDARWPAFVTAFDGFEAVRVAAYGEFEIDRLMHTDGVVHSAKKIVGTIANAQALLALQAARGAVAAYTAGFASYAALFADARARFAFLGDLSCYYWLFRSGAPVPLFEDWIARQQTDHPRMREMVEAGRAAGTSTERAGF